MKTVVHFLPANRPVPRALVAALMADAGRGARVVLVRPFCGPSDAPEPPCVRSSQTPGS